MAPCCVRVEPTNCYAPPSLRCFNYVKDHPEMVVTMVCKSDFDAQAPSGMLSPLAGSECRRAHQRPQRRRPEAGRHLRRRRRAIQRRALRRHAPRRPDQRLHALGTHLLAVLGARRAGDWQRSGAK